MMRQVKVNIPLLDMIKQVSTYAKFLKDLCTIKRELNVNKKAFLTEQVSAIVQFKSLVKYKDSGYPTILVMIGGTCVEKTLLDLGASVNLLPYSVYKQLGLGELKPTSITLSLSDRFMMTPRGMIEDVLVQVDKFYYPMDFVVLDTNLVAKWTNYVPIILEIPFLATSNAIINFRNGVMQLTFGNTTLELNIFYLCKKQFHPNEEKGPEEVCMIDNLVEEHCDQKMLEDLNESLGDLDEGLSKPSDLLATLPPWKRREEILPLFNGKETQEAIKEKPPKRILKPLPTKLKYAYVEENKQNPVVISSSLTTSQEDCLLQVLKRYSPWVSHTQVMPKKSGIIVVQNDKGEEVSTRLTSGWRVCIDYRKLNVVTRKDHFLLPFIDQVLKRVSGHPFYCFLDGYSSDMVECIMEVFMDDITIYGSTFEKCLINLETVLNRCIEKDLVLNWEKYHFMVHQGIVLGHIISKQGIEVDKANVELIVKLSLATTVKRVSQFLGHAGFYRRFDSSPIGIPLIQSSDRSY
ncbi:hypothetical protein CK203_107860 [Vitis vinifera]|uniref:Reverse transcriptase domain-containing protein n=1 Tax=Vitis vinifera TaxID=29760 RepID=A0A438CI71_VITVI|nr:hypothetical protein CK203_107860 [Vitis vinifera]